MLHFAWLVPLRYLEPSSAPHVFFPLLAVPQATCLALQELVSVFLPQVRPQLLSECPLPDSSWRLAKFRPAVSFSHEACSRTVCKFETSEDLLRAFPHLRFCLRGCCCPLWNRQLVAQKPSLERLCPFPNRQLIAQNSFFESLSPFRNRHLVSQKLMGDLFAKTPSFAIAEFPLPWASL